MKPVVGSKKKRPPASLFALGHRELPQTLVGGGAGYRFVKLFKHDFFAATALYEEVRSGAGGEKRQCVLKVQRIQSWYGFPMKWLGKFTARHESRVYEALQGIRGIPNYLGRVGETGLLHAFVPGVELREELSVTEAFFSELQTLLQNIHERDIAYVDANKGENILVGEDGMPWLIDFQISYRTWGGIWKLLGARWMFRRLVRADWYHFYKHKTRMLPSSCTAEEFERAKKRGILHRLHRWITRPITALRRRFLSRYDLADTQ